MRLIAALGMALIVCAAAGASDRKTTLRIYVPAGHVGREAEGACSGESRVTPRAHAWRCSIGTRTYDPCFSAGPSRTVVNCPKSPWLRAFVTRIQLAKPLTAVHPGAGPMQGMPWAVKLWSGAVCTRFLGKRAIERRRVTYRCTDRRTTLLGNPIRKAPLWTMVVAVGQNPTRIGRLAIQEAVW